MSQRKLKRFSHQFSIFLICVCPPVASCIMMVRWMATRLIIVCCSCRPRTCRFKSRFTMWFKSKFTFIGWRFSVGGLSRSVWLARESLFTSNDVQSFSFFHLNWTRPTTTKKQKTLVYITISLSRPFVHFCDSNTSTVLKYTNYTT